MRYGQFLPVEGTIGFVAPSFGCNIEPYYSSFKNALAVWEKEGYRLKCGPNAFEGSGLGISNSPEKCAEEFNDWYASGETDVLISCGGGELMCEILDHVDFEAIRQGKPKWFMGYSDNTNLVFLLTTLCDTAAIYGPCAPAFGMEPRHPALLDAMKLLRGETRSSHGYELWEKESLKTEDNPLQPYHVTEPSTMRCWLPERRDAADPAYTQAETGDMQSDTASRSARGEDQDSPEEIHMEGRLLGGCLDSLINLCGTRFDQVAAFNEKYKEDGVIWFLESCDLTVFGIRRGFWQLAHAGWFDNAKGFIIGRPYCYGQEIMGLDQYRAVTDMLKGYGVPVVMDADIGHLPPMMPLVSGSLAKVTVKGNEIQVEMEYR